MKVILRMDIYYMNPARINYDLETSHLNIIAHGLVTADHLE